MVFAGRLAPAHYLLKFFESHGPGIVLKEIK